MELRGNMKRERYRESLALAENLHERIVALQYGAIDTFLANPGTLDGSISLVSQKLDTFCNIRYRYRIMGSLLHELYLK